MIATDNASQAGYLDDTTQCISYPCVKRKQLYTVILFSNWVSWSVHILPRRTSRIRALNSQSMKIKSDKQNPLCTQLAEPPSCGSGMLTAVSVKFSLTSLKSTSTGISFNKKVLLGCCLSTPGNISCSLSALDFQWTGFPYPRHSVGQSPSSLDFQWIESRCPRHAVSPLAPDMQLVKVPVL